MGFWLKVYRVSNRCSYLSYTFEIKIVQRNKLEYNSNRFVITNFPIAFKDASIGMEIHIMLF